MIFELFLLCATLSLVFFVYIKRAQTYWARRNVPYIEPTSIWGNMEGPFKFKHGLKFDVKNGYDEFKRRGLRHGGLCFLTQAVYIPVDVELIKCIFSKDFQYFEGRGIVVDEKVDPLSANLLSLNGERWKYMRSKLTPTFTSGKIKQMFNALLQSGDPMLEHIEQLCKNGMPLDAKEVLACYTTDVIGSCAFGLEFNSFKSPDAKFRTYGRNFLKPGLKIILFQFINFVFPSVAKMIKFKAIPKEIDNFFLNTVQGILDYRTSNNIKRNDFVDLFLEMQQKARENNQELLTLEQITAQSLLFFVGGFETSSSTMTFCLHELAFNQDIQDKLRDEIKGIIKNNAGQLTYDGIMQMTYLDQVIKETLRKYPILPILPRKCNMDYKVPDTDVVIESGTTTLISVLGLHRDEEYYPNPSKFDPERFNDENKDSIPQFAYLPFGEGPRICMGLRFGLLQTKTGLSMILSNYRILPGEDEKYDLEFDPQSNTLTKKGTLNLKVEKL